MQNFYKNEYSLLTLVIFMHQSGIFVWNCGDQYIMYGQRYSTWHHMKAVLVMHMVFVNMSGVTYTPRSSRVNAADILSCLDFSTSTLLKALLLCFIKTVLFW